MICPYGGDGETPSGTALTGGCAVPPPSEREALRAADSRPYDVSHPSQGVIRCAKAPGINRSDILVLTHKDVIIQGKR